ncbi:MAG: hypothetical protein M3N43_14770 [Actinomycetota bacterium]|nr:hypothetical protein [Actinomycetota bacterium]
MKRVARLADLTPAMQRVVLALIDADKSVKPETVPTSPDKRRGTASDKEKVTG